MARRIAKLINLAKTSLSDLRKQLIPDMLPRAEQYRTFFGRSVDLNRIQSAMRSADDGLMVDLTDLEREMCMLDPHLSSVCGKRFNSIGCLDWSLTAAAGEHVDKELATRIADKVRRDLERIPQLSARLVDMAWGAFDARAALEIHWGVFPGPDGWRPLDLRWIHPRRISYGAERELRLIDTWARRGNFSSEDGFAFNDFPGKFLQYQPRLFNEYPEREGLGPRTLYWAFFKRVDWRMRMALTEMFGIPWRIVEADKESNVNYEELQAAADEAESLGETTTCVMPPGAKLNIATPGEHDGQLFKMTSDDVNMELSKLVLGATGTTDAVANRAESIVHKTEQEISLVFDAGGISGTMQQLVEFDVALNFGDAVLDHCPNFWLRAEPARDQLKELERIERVLALSVPVALEEVRDVAGVREPAKDEAYVVASPGGKDAFGNALPASMRIVDPTEPPTPPTTPELPAQPIEEAGADGQVAAAEQDMELARASGRPLTLPFAGYEDFDACVTDQQSKGHDEESARRICGALQSQVEADRDDAERQVVLLCASERTGLFEATPKAPPAEVPSKVFGSVDDVLELEGAQGAEHVGVLAAAFEQAADPSLSAAAIGAALNAAYNKLDLEPLVDSIQRTMVRAIMLGALDADWEAEHDEIVQPASFARDCELGRRRLLEATMPNFVRRTFEEAVKAFLGRKVMGADEFYKLVGLARKRAFTISGMLSRRMIDLAHSELAATISAGEDLAGFRKALARRFSEAGYTPLNRSHVEVVYRNATMASYATGRDVQMRQPAVLEARPYWQIVTVADSRRRPTHGAVHGKVLHYGDAFWAAGPPFGHNCRCRKVSRSAADIERLGLEVITGADISGLPDPGWT